MDESRKHWKETTAGCLAVALILLAAVIVGRCSVPANAEIEMTTATSQEPDWVGYDLHTNAARALADLDVYLHSVTTTTTPSRSAAAPQADPAAPSPTGDRWDQLAECESGGKWDYPPVTGGFSGGIMFHIGTWRSNGGLDYAADAYLASREEQIVIAERVLAGSGWNAWPGCSRKFGWM